VSQSTDPSDQSVLVFPDWKVVHEVENSMPGAKELFDGALDWTAGRGGKLSKNPESLGRRRSWTLPYRAVVLLCKPIYLQSPSHIAHSMQAPTNVETSDVI
jgi:hypothetical protein